VRLRAATRIRFTATAPTQEAGLVVFQNQRQHATLALTVDASGTPQAVLTAVEAGTATRHATLAVPDGEIVLAVDSDETGYTFHVEETGTWTTLGSIERPFFSTERAGGFVGVHIGLYGTGDTGEAHVRWFEYTPG
jgi:xylan 1,4-beta-xylosidase